MDLLIGLDVGTSAVKGVVVSVEGDIIVQRKRSTQFLHPQPDFIELSPEAHYRTVCELIQELVSRIRRDYLGPLARGKLTPQTHTIEAIADLLINHMRHEDRKYGAYLAARQADVAQPPAGR